MLRQRKNFVPVLCLNFGLFYFCTIFFCKAESGLGLAIFIYFVFIRLKCKHTNSHTKSSAAGTVVQAFCFFTCFHSTPLSLMQVNVKIASAVPLFSPRRPLSLPPFSLSKNFHLNESPASVLLCLKGRGEGPNWSGSLLSLANASTPPASQPAPCTPSKAPGPTCDWLAGRSQTLY